MPALQIGRRVLDVAPWRRRQLSGAPARFAWIVATDPAHLRRTGRRRRTGYACLRIGPWRIALCW